MFNLACSHKVLKSQKVRAAFIKLSLYSEKQNERLVGDHDSAKGKQGSRRGFWRVLFFSFADAPPRPPRQNPPPPRSPTHPPPITPLIFSAPPSPPSTLCPQGSPSASRILTALGGGAT